jgi:alkanesulfonate monooxygenase SsuD/methylene tetrahydromethanopterin reductase-like flavin-dependent oxidoreductase (luciferase family)
LGSPLPGRLGKESKVDYGRELQFGIFPTPEATEAEALVALVRRADELGLDLIGIQDHPYQRRFLDTWTLLAFLAAHTKRIRLFPAVASLPLRPPAMLAKAAASLDALSGGRLELGLGAGAFWDGIRAMDGPVRRPGEAVAALEEAIQVIRLMWSGQRSARFEGQHYHLRGVHPGPPPAHPIGIWLGAYGPRMLALTGRLADGWFPSASYAPPTQLRGMQQRIDDAAAQSSRAPASIQRLYNLSGRITGGASAGFLDGPVNQWVDELTRLALEQGVDSFIFGPAESSRQQVDRFALEVVPAVRAAVARGRAAAQATTD